MKYNIVILILSLFLLVGIDNAGAQQQIKVRGEVVDTQGVPIIGASVIVEGTQQGIITDVDGKFALDCPNTASMLDASMLGYADRKIAIAGKTYIIIILEEDVQSIESIVVTGYGNGIKKEALTGSISNVGSSKLEKSTATHVSSALAGKIAGVNFRQTNGEPGMATTISVRNFGKALYVIDGVQSTQGSFNNLDFNDIESISVLKDASAAIYGVQAGQGVVVVTTKNGSKNTKSTVNVTTYWGLQSWFRYPQPASVEQYVSSYIQSDAIVAKQNPSHTPKFTMADLEAYRNGTKKGFDWYGFVVKNNAPQAYMNANISGGNEKMNYYISFGGLDQTSVLNNFGGFKRYNVQVNVDANVSKRFKMGARFNGRYEDLYHPAVPGDDIWAAIFAIWRNPPTARPYANDNPDYPAVTSNTMSTNFGILNYERSGYFQTVTRVGQLNLNADYKIADGLSMKALAGYYYGNSWNEVQEYTYDLYEYDNVNDAYNVVYSLDNPFRMRTVSYQQQLTGQLQLVYDKQIGKHSFDGLLAAEVYKEENPSFYTWSRPLSSSITKIDFDTLEKYVDNGINEKARAGFVGRFNYNYDERYYIEVSGRYDGSWKFRSDMRWGLFPSVSGGWRISEENFWKDGAVGNWFDFLKIRASYGIMGDDNVINAFQYLSGYTYGSGGATLDGEFITGAVTRGIPTTSISWIKIKMFDAGIDFGFFRNRLNGSLDYFNRVGDGIKGQRYDVLIPSETGLTLPFENLDSDIHRGIDGNISWSDRAGEWQYSAGATFTYSRYYTGRQYKPRFGNSWNEYRTSALMRYGNITWGYVSDGQFQSWDEIAACGTDIDGKGNSTLRPGDIRYKDLNGDKIINDLDTRPIGYSEGIPPNLNFGINLTAAYKGFDIAMDFTGGAFGTYHINYEVRNPFWDGGNTAAFVLENQWHLSDISDADSELIPGLFPTSIAGNSSHSNYWVSDFWYKNITYIKLKNFEIGYTLPATFTTNIGIDRMRFYLFGQNLFAIDNMGAYEIDPEVASESALSYPTTRIMGAGLKLTF